MTHGAGDPPSARVPLLPPLPSIPTPSTLSFIVRRASGVGGQGRDSRGCRVDRRWIVARSSDPAADADCRPVRMRGQM